MLARAPRGAVEGVCLRGLMQVVGQGGGRAGRGPCPSHNRAQRSGKLEDVEGVEGRRALGGGHELDSASRA